MIKKEIILPKKISIDKFKHFPFRFGRILLFCYIFIVNIRKYFLNTPVSLIFNEKARL